MNEREQQALDNKLIRAIVNGKDDIAMHLLKDGASHYAHDCMAVKEAINNDRLDMLKVLLSDEKLMQHVQANPDIVCAAFIDEPQNSMKSLSYIANETNIDVDSFLTLRNGFAATAAHELVKKFRLNYQMTHRPPRAQSKSNSFKMKI